MPDDSKTGCPSRPLKIKCTSMGFPQRDKAYWCIVSEGGQQFYFDVSVRQAELIGDQAGEFVKRAT